MNICVDTAYQLLRGFSRLEFTLLKVPQFIDGSPDKRAQVHWKRVARSLSALPLGEFVDLVSDTAKGKILAGNRNRPKRQLVRAPEGAERFVEFDFDPLPDNDAAALLEATRRARNNMFHGGKEDPREQPYDGDDQDWLDAALDVLGVLLDLPWRRMGQALDRGP